MDEEVVRGSSEFSRMIYGRIISYLRVGICDALLVVELCDRLQLNGVSGHADPLD